MHRIVVNVQTGDVTKVEYTAQEQAEYEAAKIANDAAEAEAARLAAEQAAQGEQIDSGN